ncbi:MAG: Trm112 family protein [Calditrichia bacterium]
MLKKELLDILVCPKCKGDLEYKPDEQNDTQGKLICHSCQLFYRVEDDIPVMLIEEAQPIEKA